MVKLVMLKDDELGREGDVVEVDPKDAMGLVENGVARVETDTDPGQAAPSPAE